MTTDTEYLRQIADRAKSIDESLRIIVGILFLITAALAFIAGCLIV